MFDAHICSTHTFCVSECFYKCNVAVLILSFVQKQCDKPTVTLLGLCQMQTTHNDSRETLRTDTSDTMTQTKFKCFLSLGTDFLTVTETHSLVTQLFDCYEGL